MKKLRTVMYILLLVCVAGTAVFLVLLPDQVPMHYNMAGSVDRIGSKYESLLWPAIIAGFTAFFLLLAKAQRKKGEKSNEKILLYTGICTLLFFTLMEFYFMLKALNYDPAADRSLSMDHINQFVNIGIGALLMALGNIMPKARKNAVFGLRTKWSMANDAVWQKSQRFSGIACVIAGFCVIALSLFVPGAWNIAVLMAAIIILSILCVYASYRYYQQVKERETNEEV